MERGVEYVLFYSRSPQSMDTGCIRSVAPTPLVAEP